MQYFATIYIFVALNLGHLSVSYHRNTNIVRVDWAPPEHAPAGLAPPVVVPVEEVNYSIVSAPLIVGSALHWDGEQNVLYFVDVKGQELYRYDPATKVQKSIKFDAPVSLVIPIKGEKHHMVLGLGGEMTILRWIWDTDNYATSHLFSVYSQRTTSSWGTGRADSLGRIWAEAVADRRRSVNSSSSLYKVDTVSSCRVDSVLGDQNIINGLAWSLDNKVLYSSSTSRKIEAFDFDSDSGNISNPRTVFDFGDLPGSPAGITVDKDGNLWVGSSGDSQVKQINPNGQLLRQLKLPVKQVTSVVFGGPKLEDLYVSSGSADEGEGAVLKITDLKDSGVLMNSADILCKPL